MKKLLLTVIAVVLMAGNISAQGVARECVLIEAFTGIGCPYCPAAANGIAQMLEEGLSIVPLAFHNSYYSPPQYATSETNARATYYNVNSFPTVLIDGMNRIEGGGTASSSMYSNYKPYYDQRINVPSPFSIDLSFEYHSGTQCVAKAVVNKVAECDGNDVRVFIALTESHIQQSWQGLQELNAVVRDVVTVSAGEQLTSDTQEVTGLFSVAGYPKENLQLVAWVQNYSGTREVYQAVKLSMGDVTPQYDLGITTINEVPTEMCSGKIAPLMTIRNNGTQTLTSATFNIKNDDEVIDTYEWTGNLTKGQQETIDFEEFTFTGSEFSIEAVNLNGSNNDEYDYDNMYKYVVSDPATLEDGYMKIQVRIGDNPENFSIKIMNMNTGELLHNFTFEESDKVYQEIVNLPEFGCYRVTFVNTAGNGIGDAGFWGIKDKNNQTVVSGGVSTNAFEYEFPIELKYSGVNIEEIESLNDVNIYPNPASSVINVTATNLTKIKIYNAVGQLIHNEEVSSDNVTVDTQDWTNGFYYVTVETANGNSTSQKIIVNK